MKEAFETKFTLLIKSSTKLSLVKFSILCFSKCWRKNSVITFVLWAIACLLTLKGSFLNLLLVKRHYLKFYMKSVIFFKFLSDSLISILGNWFLFLNISAFPKFSVASYNLLLHLYDHYHTLVFPKMESWESEDLLALKLYWTSPNDCTSIFIKGCVAAAALRGVFFVSKAYIRNLIVILLFAASFSNSSFTLLKISGRLITLAWFSRYFTSAKIC